MDQPDVLVVGAGAAGIIAAWRSASLGARTLLLEKTNRLGTKILISGGGKCNITHDGELEDVLRAFRPNEARFIRPACYRFTNRQIVKLLTDRGLRVYTREDGRIFPVDQTAKDVVNILRRYLTDVGVEVRFNIAVSALESDDKGISGVHAGALEIPAKNVIVATGGSSYPNSGTTGDAWPWARELGHTIVKVRAALAPIYLDVDPERAGVALRDVVLKARVSSKEVARWRGDLLFTHRGISGPTALGISRIITEQMEHSPVHLEVDLAPDWSFEQASHELQAWRQQNPRKQITQFLETIVPKSLCTPLLESANIDKSTVASGLAQKSHNRLVETIKGWALGPVRTVPLEKGECVAGGVSLEEVDPKSMESKLVPGLFLCGEALDMAGPVGGYNLQAAFATGYVAGESAANRAGYRLK
ncbi:MAG TPA: NAD(P)/FAD-dependent oxidoreductase [Fimbriimonadaceae bacterium]|nr:NAD(P)/FAD-dependent oxidoreductase [Fimbriimonadaceae bacterium]